MKKNFKNSVELGFYDYLLCQKYAERTAWHYITRCRKVESLNVLIRKNIDPYIAEFESGSCKSINEKCHGAYSCALKRFKEYQVSKGIIVL